ncbi:hypothetical protein [Mycobacteroides immunogenum]|uniref:hypothetical protein n=1 Tax=Mycobacteroides immunogenum TaxID=83262 RepID=UPI0013F4DE14|nr:hypothetical protein [Mycobacteroides immunogenum]
MAASMDDNRDSRRRLLTVRNAVPIPAWTGRTNMQRRYLVSGLLISGAVCALATASPAFANGGGQSCVTVPNANTVCSSPGNVQITSATPIYDGPQPSIYPPYYPFGVGGYLGTHGHSSE